MKWTGKLGWITGLITLCILGASIPRPVDAQSSCPRGVRQRREIRTLTDAQRNTFFAAVKRLQSGARPTRYDNFTSIHYSVRTTAHGYAWFFSWHRAYLVAFEKALQEHDPSIMLPFWDWSYDSQAPELAPVWQSTWYGGNGRASDNCVVDGQFSNWRPAYPSDHCLRRRWDDGNELSAFYSTDALRDIMRRTTSYDTFRREIESVPHGQVHVAIGLDMSTMYSPNDPMFWAHHTFIDKLWADWQAMSSGRAASYNGQNANGRPARLTDVLSPYPQTVQQVMRTTSLCYTYAAFPTTTAPLPTAAPASAPVPATAPATRDIPTPIKPSTGTDTTGNPAPGRNNNNNNNSNSKNNTAPATPAAGGAGSGKTENTTPLVPAGGTGTLPVVSPANEASAIAKEPAVVVPVTAEKPTTPPPTDREELACLRAVRPVPDEWLRGNNHDVGEARKTEQTLYAFTDSLNKQKDYVSPVALIRRPELVRILASQKPRLTVTSGNERAVINTRLAQNLSSMLGRAVRQVATRNAGANNNNIIK